MPRTDNGVHACDVSALTCAREACPAHLAYSTVRAPDGGDAVPAPYVHSFSFESRTWVSMQALVDLDVYVSFVCLPMYHTFEKRIIVTYPQSVACTGSSSVSSVVSACLHLCLRLHVWSKKYARMLRLAAYISPGKRGRQHAAKKYFFNG